MKNLLLRNMLYVPAYQKKFIEKSLLTNADAYIYDLEDSVPDVFKKEARSILKTYLENGSLENKRVFVRLNSKESGLLQDDLKATAHQDVFGFMPSKINTVDDVRYYDQLLTQIELELDLEIGYFKLAPLIETTLAILNVYEICKASKRIVAVCFGGEDFLNDVQGIHNKPLKVFDYPRAAIIVAARAAGVQPIDTPYLEVHDKEGFLLEERQAYEMGFAGVQVLSPRQIPFANECFSPSQEEIETSIEVMEACRKSAQEGSGVVMYKGKMMGPPMRKRAEKVLEMTELIKKYDKNTGGVK